MAEAPLSWNMKILFATIFALTLPVGIVFGLIATTGQNTQTSLTYGCANSIAAGSLLYTALVEMVSEDFHSISRDRFFLKVGMFFSLTAGFAVMAILAVWG